MIAKAIGSSLILPFLSVTLTTSAAGSFNGFARKSGLPLSILTGAEDTNPKYFKLLQKFKGTTKCPVLVNTSFNVRGEPIVNTPEDAYNCFMLTDMDYLVMGNYILDKTEQNEWSDELKNNYLNKFELD